jgi:HSP20 family molecular chaperone IbpA
MYKINYSDLSLPAILGRVNYSSPLLDSYEKAVGDLLAFSSAEFSSRMKLNEEDKYWELSLELPGYSNKDIDVSVEDNVLIVRARNEKFGETTKTLELWQGIHMEGISGKMENGILVVKLPKEEKKRNTIRVE